MSDVKRLSGKCLCGAVRFEADVAEADVGVCHCDICRHWTAGPFMAIEGASDLLISGTDALGVYRSSEWGERGFCKECGTSLFWRSLDGEHCAISVSVFDEMAEPRFATEVFIDSKPGWYEFANETNKITGAELFAQFAPKQE